MTARSPLPALAALASGTFAIGVTEFVVTGLLPEIARSYTVSIPTAGLLISGYAIGVVVGSPVMTALVLRMPRRRVLIGLLLLFVAGNVLSGLAPDFATMMAGRVVAALCHGAFIGIASIVAGDLVTPERRSQAIAVMLTGLTVANVLGVPLGTLLGQLSGWRSTFWAISGLGVLAILAIAWRVPPTRADRGVRLRGQLRGFRRAQVWLALTMTALSFGSVYATLTYVAPLMTERAGFASTDLTWILAVFGCALVVGNLVGGRAADRALMWTLCSALPALTATFVVFFFGVDGPVTALPIFLVIGFLGFATVPGLTTRVITSAGDEGEVLASSAAVAAFNLGNAAGAYLGGRVIAFGWGYPSTSLVSATMSALAFCVALASAGLSARTRRSADLPVVTGPSRTTGRTPSGRPGR
ncbi:MFS transporter [Actinoallomurus acaciae]|uniref:MFS transporter n=1 Tax=Actinoallomurus acaciae TaxID=502577 RepID=A0ABV5YPI2_9ACTN